MKLDLPSDLQGEVVERFRAEQGYLGIAWSPDSTRIAVWDEYGWGARGGFPMKDLTAYTAWQERMMQRPTVRKTVESEQSISTS